MRPADLFEQGVIPAEGARQVGVFHQTASDWRVAWRRAGRDGLRRAGRAGRLPKLRRDQLTYVELERPHYPVGECGAREQHDDGSPAAATSVQSYPAYLQSQPVFNI